MNQKIIGGLVLVALVAIGAWYFSGSSVEAPAAVESTDERDTGIDVASESVATDNNLSGMGSFATLMGRGQSLVCEFTYESEETNAASAGTVYIDGERMRGDFETTQGGTLYRSYMIQDGEHVYTWSESPQGTFAMKMKANTADDTSMAESAAAADTQASFDLSHEVDYNCRVWGVDERQFVPPSNINFMDMEAMMQGAMPDMSNFTY